MDETPILIADVGGTNIRFAIARAGAIGAIRVLPTQQFRGLFDSAEVFLADIPPAERPKRAAVAVAAPVVGDQITLTNSPWTFSIRQARICLGLGELVVLNDFAATAMALPFLGHADRLAVGPALQAGNGPLAVLGPGTGLGVAGMVGTPDRWVLVPGEGGHVTMAAANEEEARVLDWLRARFGHVSAERVISGQGLVNLHDAILGLAGLPAQGLDAAGIAAAALAGRDAHCARAFAMFCDMLGTVAGNLALTLGATGGVYIAGGILPRYASAFRASGFRARFEAKGRFSGYVAGIPTFLVTHPEPVLLGLANAPG